MGLKDHSVNAIESAIAKGLSELLGAEYKANITIIDFHPHKIDTDGSFHKINLSIKEQIEKFDFDDI